jgi:hypothetical protein
MAAGTAAEANQMLRIRGEVGHSRIDNPTRLLHTASEIRMRTRGTRPFEREPQPLLGQIAELAAAQRCLRLGSAVKLVRISTVVFIAELQRRTRIETANPPPPVEARPPYRAA